MGAEVMLDEEWTSERKTPLLETPKGRTHSSSSHVPVEDGPVFRSAIVVVFPLFMGYAALFSLQGRIRSKFDQDHMSITKDSFQSIFQAGVSCLYLGNFFLRLGHNLVFAPFPARIRVYLSQLSMLLSMCILFALSVTAKDHSLNENWLALIFVAYFLGGVAIGSFEANILNSLVPLGHSTKLWAIAGMPVGIVSVTVGGYLILQFDGDRLYPVYLMVIFLMLVSVAVFFFFIPSPQHSKQALSLSQFFSDVRQWRHWLPKIPMHTIAMAFNMFAVSCAIPVAVYLYTSDGNNKSSKVNMSFLGHVSHDVFMIIYDAFFSSADLISRRVFFPAGRFSIPLINPFFFLLFSGGGFALLMSKVPILAPLGGFLIAWGNGSMYAQACYYIDTRIDSAYNLTALSFWLFLGDLGSVIGTNVIKPLTS